MSEDRAKEVGVTESEANDEIDKSEAKALKLMNQIRNLEAKLAQAGERDEAYTELSEKHKRSLSLLKEARDQLKAAKQELENLAQPPSSYAVFLSAGPEGTVETWNTSRYMRLSVTPGLDISTLQLGQQLRLDQEQTVVEATGFVGVGETAKVNALLDGNRALLATGQADTERVVHLAEPLLGLALKPGDTLLVDLRANIAYERIPKAEVEDLMLEEVPDISYEDIGGLVVQIEQIRDAVELPFLHPELFKLYKAHHPKGVLLYGPPGCGKTLIAKAVANSLAKTIAAERGDGEEVKSYFLSVKGPELLNKYVGETERKIREIFQRAREKASDGTPVVIFFDEMDSLFRTRGSGISSDVESTIVPQLLSELDGVEALKNVIVIGATNREDMIDPALLRPGRLDIKIKVERPDAEASRDIFTKYVTADLPLKESDLAKSGGNREACVTEMIRRTVERMYAESLENRFLEVTYQSGEKEVLYFKDFNSGAMIQNIVDRAKKLAIKQFLLDGTSGISTDHLLAAIKDEFSQNEDLPNTTNPDDWAKISGRKGQRITFVRTLVSKGPTTQPREVTTVNTGQYL